MPGVLRIPCPAIAEATIMAKASQQRSIDTAPVAPFTIVRRVDAPRTTVWVAFTDPDRLDQWWGPKGCPTRVTSLDFRIGGTFLYAMTFPDSQTHHGKWLYREVRPPERIVADVSFCNAEGVPIRNPYMPELQKSGASTVRSRFANASANSSRSRAC
jgi:uncharacterized protein YndB with AHSA1/START domain